MEVLAVIPARAGSSGIKDKNILDIGGKPLLAYTIECAEESKYVSRTIVSTDSPLYAKISREYGAETPFIRPSKLASSEVHAVHVVCHCLEELQIDENYQPDLVVMLLPTSPLRRTSSIDNSIKLYLDEKPQSVISVCESAKQLLHFRYIRDGLLVPVEKRKNYNIQRQDAEKLFELNGSIYVSSPNEILANRSFHLPHTIPFVMSFEESIDLNEPRDLNQLEFFLKKRAGSP